MVVSNQAPKSGNFVGKDGKIHNIVDLLGGGTPVSEHRYNIRDYAAMSGLVLGSDGKAYDLVELIQNFSGGGGGGTPVTWPVPGTPTTFPPAPHNHPEYTTEQQVSDLIAAHADNQTIKMQSGELKATALDGLTLTPGQINALLAGAIENYQVQIDKLKSLVNALSSGGDLLDKFETYADLMQVSNKTNGDWAIVLNDEMHNDRRSWYVYSGSLDAWMYIGDVDIVDQFIALQDTPGSFVGQDGKVLRVDEANERVVFDDVRWSEIDGRPERTKAQIEAAVDKAHTHEKTDAEISSAVELAHPHPNIAALNRIGIDGQGRITIDGVPYVPASQNKQRLFAYRSGSDQPLTAGTDCVFNTKHSGDIPYDTATGVFTLEAGKLYRVEVAGSLYTSGWVILQLVNAETNSIVNTIARGIWMDVNPSTTSWHESSSGPLKTYIVPAATRGYKIRATSVSGESSLRSSYMSLEIVEI